MNVMEDTLEYDYDASPFFRQFGSCFRLSDIAELTQYKYIGGKTSLQNRQKKLAKVPLFYLFLKLIQINFIFTNNIHILDS